MTEVQNKMSAVAEEMIVLSEVLQRRAIPYCDSLKLLRATQLHILALQMRGWLLEVKNDEEY